MIPIWVLLILILIDYTWKNVHDSEVGSMYLISIDNTWTQVDHYTAPG